MIELKENIKLGNKTAIHILGNVQIGTFGMHKKIKVEASCAIGQSQLDIGKIGAFTIINMGDLKSCYKHQN